MARPNYPDPVAPTLASPLYGATEGAPCGGTFTADIEVRYPYGETDVFVRELPRLWHMVLDISRAFPELEQRIAEGIAEATTDLDKYDALGDVDRANFEAIDEILDRASEYLDYCIGLREYWDEQQLEYVDSGGIEEADARSWLSFALTAEEPRTLNRCWQKPGGEVVRLELPGGGWVEYRCPSPEFRATYAEDWTNYKDTLLKAALQARCAQEALYSLVAYNVNRKKAEEGPVGPPRPVVPGERLEAPPPSGAEPPVAPPPRYPTPPTEPEPGWSTGKKVAVGVAVLGLIGGAYWLITRTKEPRSALAEGTT